MSKSSYLQIDEHWNVDKKGQQTDWDDVHCQMLPPGSDSQMYSVGMWRAGKHKIEINI